MNKLQTIQNQIYTSRLVYGIDFLIFLLFSFLLLGLYHSSNNENLFAHLSAWGTLGSLVFASYQHVLQRIDRRKVIEYFKTESESLIKPIELIIEKHYPEIDPTIFTKCEELTLSACLSEFSRTMNIQSIEYQFISSYIDYLQLKTKISTAELIFIKYRIITSFFQNNFPKFKIDHIDLGTLRDNPELVRFGKLISLFEENSLLCAPFDFDSVSDSDGEDSLFNYFELSSAKVKKLLEDNEKRKKAEILLSKAIDNAYTNLNLLNISKLEEKIPALFKYDEKYSATKTKWKAEVETHLRKKNKIQRNASEEEISDHEKFITEESERILTDIDTILGRQPFSKALYSFKKEIKQLGKDFFWYIIFPENFSNEARGWTPEKFIKEKVIKKARELQSEFNVEILKKYPFLKGKLKRKLDANYYIIYIDPTTLKINADLSTTPKPLKEALTKSFFSSEDREENFQSQLIYLKQVINSLSLSGLLFTEPFEIQDKYAKIEKRIITQSEKLGLNIRNVNSIAELGNKKDELVKIVYKIIHKKNPPTSKRSIHLKTINSEVEKIIQNAIDLVQIISQMRSKKKENDA
ncbi:hypothetical protein [Leptonema illini]|uniref:Uncharacterized protein n=1 Tax=Leptonema illini DSM 21528 TaxID=929563 RepID=H2CGR2_9LEPT|nr:hypothetical protein [Leptonema illini]EHQ04738.1 hypothetical protein Lepil_0027 [Leptonema illini DSM 21528]